MRTVNETTLDVIIPVKNGKRYIRDSVGCILRQTIASQICILLIDDGSVDGTAEICDDLASGDSRITVYHIAASGVSAARNFGLSRSSSEFVAFMDADDFVYDDCYETLLINALENNCDISACAYVKTQSRSMPERAKSVGSSVFLYTEKRAALENMICGNNSIEGYVWNKVYRRDLIKNISFPVYRFCEDCIFSWDAVSAAARICYTDKPLYVYYVSHKLYAPMDDGIRVYDELLRRCHECGIDKREVIHCLKSGYVDHVIAFARNIALTERDKNAGKTVLTKSDARRYLKKINTKGVKISFVQRIRRFLLKHCWPLFVLSEKIIYAHRRRRHENRIAEK